MVTLSKLNASLDQVQDELIQLGFYDSKLEKINIFLVPIGYAHGWQKIGSTGEICIPAISFCKLLEMFDGTYCSLSDILRHEYGHAFAFTHKRLIASKKFTQAFGNNHYTNISSNYDRKSFVSEYAAENPMEDFAETFMYFVKRLGNIDDKFNYPAIRKKWKFLMDLTKQV